jgi:Bacterial membrane protein YfhO
MVRRPRSSWIDRVMYLLLGFFVIATIGQALVGGATLLDVNLLTHFQPFQALHGQSTAAANLCRGDTLDSVMPSLSEIRTRLLNGDFPGWSSSEVGGAPLAGLPNFGQFGPLALPYYLLPLWLAPAFVKLGEFVVAIGGMVLYLRRLRLSTASGVLAGIVFASSGFMLAWTNWPQTRVAAFIPLFFWAVERLIQRHRLVDALPLAAVTASMLLGGFPAVTGMTFYCAGLYFLFRMVLLHRSTWRTLLAGTSIAVFGLALGAALTAFQLLPFARQLSTMDLGYREQDSLAHSTLSTLLTTMVPDAQGVLCVPGESFGGGNSIENLAFVGVAAVLLALVAVTVRARKPDPRVHGVVGFLAITTVFVIIVGWFGGELLAMLAHLPVFSENSITRIRSVFGFLLAALAGFGFEKLLGLIRDEQDGPEDDPGRGTGSGPGQSGKAAAMAVNTGPEDARRPTGRTSPFSAHLIGPVAVSLAALVLAAFILKDARDQARVSGVTAHLRGTLTVPAILLVVCLLAIVAVRFAAKPVRYLAIVTIAIIAVGQSASAFREAIPGSDPANFYPVTSTHRFLQQSLGLDRFAGSGQIMYPATSRYYGLRTPTGHEFTTDPWKALLHAVDPASQVTPTFSDFSEKAVNASSAGHIPLLDQMAVRYFVATDSDVVGKQAPAPATRGTVRLAADQVVQCRLSAGPLRAVTVNFSGPLTGSSLGAIVHVRVHTPAGDITGARSLGAGLSAPAPVSVAVPGEDVSAATAATAQVWVSGASAPFALAGEAGIPACGTVTPVADGLKLVASDAGAIVYQRLTSLPRIRWASTSRVQTDPNARVAELKAGIGATTVLLDTAAPASENKPATVKVTAGDGDRLAATVNATGAGYLVVADSMQQPGWTATIDGRPTELVPADNAMVAVRVPAGLHQVEMTYTVPGQRSGLLISGASLLAFGFVLLWWRRPRRAQPR